MREYFFRKKSRYLASPGYLLIEIIVSIVIAFTAFWGWNILIAKFFIDCFVSITTYNQQIDSILPISKNEKRNYMVAKSVLDAGKNIILFWVNVLMTYKLYDIRFLEREYYTYELVIAAVSFLLMLVTVFDQDVRVSNLNYMPKKRRSIRAKLEIIVYKLTVFVVFIIIYPIQYMVLNRGGMLFYNVSTIGWEDEDFFVISLVIGILLIILYIYEIVTFKETFYLTYKDEK